MAKKSAGPKEAQLRRMRESAAPIEIDRHALQEARAAAKAKANELYQSEMATITKPLNDQIAKLKERRTILDNESAALDSDLRKLEKAVADVLGIESPASGSRRKESSGTRTRRSAEQLKADADSIVAYLKAHPDSKASDIAKATGANFKPSLKEFMKAQGVKVDTQGDKVNMTYSLA